MEARYVSRAPFQARHLSGAAEGQPTLEWIRGLDCPKASIKCDNEGFYVLRDPSCAGRCAHERSVEVAERRIPRSR